ncbi:hypothetical protein EDC01DRAFT_373597 [Geopyxis carbonaria]|nr:hypothetical protein EDC01DRAFT_373597 [Geopyxis carbonaria]
MADFFDGCLSLEEDYHKEGYEQGHADGKEAGHIEGRIFGLEKGFEKFLEMGRLQGRCSVWNARTQNDGAVKPEALISNPRAHKNIQALSLLLTNPPFKNDEDSVEEMEEAFKRGKMKTKILERMLGEKVDSGVSTAPEKSIEDI